MKTFYNSKEMDGIYFTQIKIEDYRIRPVYEFAESRIGAGLHRISDSQGVRFTELNSESRVPAIAKCPFLDGKWWHNPEWVAARYEAFFFWNDTKICAVVAERSEDEVDMPVWWLYRDEGTGNLLGEAFKLLDHDNPLFRRHPRASSMMLPHELERHMELLGSRKT